LRGALKTPPEAETWAPTNLDMNIPDNLVSLF